MSEVSFNIEKEIGVLSENEKGWTKEINVVSWNGGEPRYDIRSWSPEREKAGKGISLTIEEVNKMSELLGFGLDNIKADTLNFDRTPKEEGEASDLDKDKEKLIGLFDRLSENDKEAVLVILSSLAKVSKK